MIECVRCGFEIEAKEPTAEASHGETEHLMWADCFKAVRNDERLKIKDELVSMQEFELAARVKDGMLK